MEKSYADLPFELTIKLVEHIECHEDFEIFGLVCTNWRNAMKLTSRYAASLQTPWFMIPPEPLFKYPSKARFYRLYNHSIRRVNLPSLDDDSDSSNDSEEDSENDYDDDHHDHDNERNCHRNLNSSRGWLVFVDYFGAMKADVCLVHPFTKERIRIPSLLYKDDKHVVYNDAIFALSECPNATTSHFTLAIIFESWSVSHLAGFWNSKDEKWVVIAKLPYVQDVTDVAFYKGEFYVVDSKGRMVVASGFDNGIRPLIKKRTWAMEKISRWNKVYLVESAGMLLQVLLFYGFSRVDDRTISRFEVREVNVDNGETREVKCLGNRTLFLGPNSCFSMEASPYCCKPNCIYYVSDLGLHKNMGVYDLISDQKIEDYIDPMLANLGTSFWVEAPSRL